jgi:hypothetical protein
MPHFLSLIEESSDHELAIEWAIQKIEFLPGETWPEAWVVNQSTSETYARLGREFGLSDHDIDTLLASVQRAGKHNEFYEASKFLNIDESIISYQLVKAALESHPEEQERISEFIDTFLE